MAGNSIISRIAKQELMDKTGSERAAFEAMEQGGGKFIEPKDIARTGVFGVTDHPRHINGVELVFK